MPTAKRRSRSRSRSRSRPRRDSRRWWCAQVKVTLMKNGTAYDMQKSDIKGIEAWYRRQWAKLAKHDVLADVTVDPKAYEIVGKAKGVTIRFKRRKGVRSHMDRDYFEAMAADPDDGGNSQFKGMLVVGKLTSLTHCKR